MKKVLFVLSLAVGVCCIGLAQADNRCLEFQAAAQDSEVNRVERFLSEGVDIDCRDTLTSETALMKAAMSGKVESVRLLLAHGANVNIRANGGWTALKYAKETYKAVKPGGKKFSALTQRVETVINLLIEVGGI